MADKAKTTWTAGDGTMTFFLPNRSSFQVPAATIDRPITMCEVLDVLAGMSSPERRAIITMATNLELDKLNPKSTEKVR